MKLTFALASAEDKLNERIRAQRQRLIDLRKQIQIHNRITPMRRQIKRNLMSAKNTKDVKMQKNLRVARTELAARIAKLERTLTTSMSPSALKASVKKAAERLTALTAKLSEARQSKD